MQLFQHTLAFTSEEDTVLAIGKFDGLHMGHKKLLDVVRREKEKGLKSAIFTFDMAPLDVITHHTTKLLTTNDEKHEIFEAIGIDYFIECPFVDEIRLLEPEDFIRMMVEKMRVKVFVVGTDCRFAHDRKGNCEVLRSYADQYGYRVDVVQKKQYESRDISSTFVREEIEKGNIGKANMLLGYPYFVQGEVLGGNRSYHRIPDHQSDCSDIQDPAALRRLCVAGKCRRKNVQKHYQYRRETDRKRRGYLRRGDAYSGV